MAIDFPNSPVTNDTHVVGDRKWVYDGEKWMLVPASPELLVVSPTPPTNTNVIWADTSVTGVGVVPVGGTTGQVLAKNSSTNYDAGWATPVTSSDLALKANVASPTFTGTVGGITKSMVGLGSVDNTADTAKPVSTAQQTALNLKANTASPTFTGTVVAPTLNATNYQKSGVAVGVLRSGSIVISSPSPSPTFFVLNLPSGCNIYNLVSVVPTTGVNNTLTVYEIRYGDWSGVQTTTQIGIYCALGNGVHLDPYYINVYWIA
jgi:hypothetical protein